MLIYYVMKILQIKIFFVLMN